jgi:hypothetical protein
MQRAEQDQKQLKDEYSKWDMARELEWVHERINQILLPAVGEDGEIETVAEDLKVNYVLGDLNTEAEIVAAFNTTNTKVNALSAAVNELITFFRQLPPNSSQN